MYGSPYIANGFDIVQNLRLQRSLRSLCCGQTKQGRSCKHSKAEARSTVERMLPSIIAALRQEKSSKVLRILLHQVATGTLCPAHRAQADRIAEEWLEKLTTPRSRRPSSRPIHVSLRDGQVVQCFPQPRTTINDLPTEILHKILTYLTTRTTIQDPYYMYMPIIVRVSQYWHHAAFEVYVQRWLLRNRLLPETARKPPVKVREDAWNCWRYRNFTGHSRTVSRSLKAQAHQREYMQYVNQGLIVPSKRDVWITNKGGLVCE